MDRTPGLSVRLKLTSSTTCLNRAPFVSGPSVENTGEKLTPQLVSTLVEPFQRRAQRVHSDHAGVGLGLAIVKSITQAHDGAASNAGSSTHNCPPLGRKLEYQGLAP